MVAVEATIVSTAMPLIVGELGGLQLYSWVFSSFLLTQTAATVVFGKLSDTYGRKPVLLAGIAVFLVGSLLCGFAWSMPSMIAFRLLQGIGAGAITPVTLTIVGDLYAASERGRVQGFLASVWGISSVAGPVVGGFIIQHLSWGWIFWINLPIGILSALGFAAFLHEGARRVRRPVDVAGAALFTVAVAALMIALTVANDGLAEAGPYAALFVASALLFVLQERRAADPMIAVTLWGRRPIAAANGAALLAGMALIGITTFLPMYVQGVLRQSPLVSGLALTVMVLGWPIGATFAARSFGRFGLRRILLAGSLLIPAGSAGFLALGSDTPVGVAAAGSLVMGLGMGLLSTASIVLIQEIVSWSERGSATASNIFSRNLGSTLGAAVFGAVMNYGLAHFGGAGGTTSDELRRLLDQASGDGSGRLTAVRSVLESAIHLTFWAVFVTACLTAFAALLVPAVTLGRAAEPATERR